MLAFNRTQIDGLNAKTHVPAAGSYEAATDPSELDYRAWVDGLADRAAKVTAPELATQATDVAKTAERLVRARLDFDAQSQRAAPGAAAPAMAMVVSALSTTNSRPASDSWRRRVRSERRPPAPRERHLLEG